MEKRRALEDYAIDAPVRGYAHTIICLSVALIGAALNPELWPVFLICGIVGILCAMGLVSTIRMRNAFRRKLAAGELDAVCDDFCEARSAFGDKLCIGKDYLFSKGMTRVVAYEDITALNLRKVGQAKNSNTFALYAELKGDGKTMLCMFDANQSTEDDLMRVLDRLKEKDIPAKLKMS